MPDLDHVIAKATPELRFVLTDATVFELLVDARLFELVVHDEVILEGIAAIADLIARLRAFVVVSGERRSP